MKPSDGSAAPIGKMYTSFPVLRRERFTRTCQGRPKILDDEFKVSILKPRKVVAISEDLADVVAVDEYEGRRPCVRT